MNTATLLTAESTEHSPITTGATISDDLLRTPQEDVATPTRQTTVAEASTKRAQSPDLTSCGRSGWRLAGSLATHLSLGILCAVSGTEIEVQKYSSIWINNTPRALSVDAWLAFLTWILVAWFVISSWSTKRRFAWLMSVAWAILVLATTTIIVVTGPTPTYTQW